MKIIERARARLDQALNGQKPALNDVREQTQAEKDLATFVKDGIEEVRNNASRIASEGVWLTNAAYLLGFDSIFYDTTAKQFKPIHYPGQFLRRHRVHVNKILPTVQNRLARLLKNPPRYDVIPKSSAEDDKQNARDAEQVILDVWRRQKINRKRIELTMALQQAGHAYLKVNWDRTLGRKMPASIDEIAQMVAEGDVRVDVCSAFEIFPDPLAKNWDELQYLTQAKIRSLSYFREQYPERGHLVKEEDVWLTSLDYEMRINSANAQNRNQVKFSAIELSRYERPSFKHPKGRHIVVANGVVLKDDECPIDEIPFIKFNDTVIAGKFNSETPVTHLRPIQDQYNRTISMRAAWANRMLTGKYISARGSGLGNTALNDQSGEVVEFDPVPNAPPPTAMNTPAIPAYAYKEDEVHVENMNDVAGINQASKGQLPSANTPAIGMQFLVEQDDTRIGVMVEDQEWSYADLGRIILKFAHKYWVTERILKFRMFGGKYAYRGITGDKLNPELEVTVIRGSSLPGSKVLKRQEIISLHKAGYLGNPTDPKVLENVLSMLEYGDMQEAWVDHVIDMAQIAKMIEDLEAGIKPAVSEFDNHPLIVQELNRYRKGEKFESLPEQGKKYLLEVMEEHIQEMVNLQVPEISDEGENDPGLKESTAAQEEEQALVQEFNSRFPGQPTPEAI